MLGSVVAKILCIMSLLVSFFSYAFTHGLCTTVDAGIAKCEVFTKHSESCSASSNSENENKSESSIHICGCIKLFTQISNLIVFGEFLSKNFALFDSRFILSDFSQRIERPPISIS